MTAYLRSRLAFLAWLSLLSALLPLAASLHFSAGLLSHLSLHIGICGALLAAGLLLLRRPLPAVAAAIAMCICAWRVLVVLPEPVAPPGSAAQPAAQERQLRVLQWNVNVNNPSPLAVTDWIASLDPAPDLIALLETGSAFQRAIADRQWRYKVLLEELREDGFGLMVLSPRTDLAVRLHRHLGSGLASAVVTLCAGAQRSPQIVITHPPPPVNTTLRRHRDAQLAELALLLRNSRDAVLLGDLNLTPWSVHLRELLLASGMGLGFAGTLPANTWAPAGFPLWLGIPIDLVLVSDGVLVTASRRGPRSGSDHAPLLSTLDFSALPCPAGSPPAAGVFPHHSTRHRTARR